MNFFKAIYLLGDLAVIGFILIFFFIKEKNKPLIKYFFPAAAFKILAGLFLGLIYFHYYKGGDTFTFFRNAEALASIGISSPKDFFSVIFLNRIPGGASVLESLQDEPRVLLTAKLIAPLHIFSRGNYFVLSTYLSLFSFIGMWKLANRLVIYFPQTKLPAVIAFLFFPSVIFWSAGVMKESIIMGIIGFILAAFLKVYKEGKWPKWPGIIALAVGMLILTGIKYYYAGLLIPILTTTLLTRFISNKIPAFQNRTSNYIYTWAGIFGFLILIATNLHPNLQVSAFLKTLVENHDKIFASSHPDSLIYYHRLKPELLSILVNTPKALLAGLFRPLLWDWGSIWQIFTAMENMMLVFFFAFSTYGIKKISVMKDTDKVLLFAAVTYILILAVTMAFASPNFGSLMRYKIGFLPLLIYIILSANQIFIEKDYQPMKIEEAEGSLKMGI